MFKKNTLLRALIAAGLTTGLAACGGGSSSGGSAADQPPGGENPPAGAELTGQFVDSPVGGLEYLRSNKGSEVYLTNDNGEFIYQDGETVTFKIGQLTLGSTQGGAVVSPRNLASEAGAINVARVLQTLDEDGDPTNGITISADVRSKAAKATTPRNIAETANLDTIEAEITGLASDAGASLVSADEAEAHLDETLTSISGSDVTSCSDDGAEQLAVSDFHDLTIGMIADDETLLFQFNSDNTFIEYNSGDDESIGAVTWDGNWAFEPTTQRLSLDFTNEYGEQDGDEFRICAAGSRVIAEPEDGTAYLYKLNDAVNETRAAGTYLLQYPDETGAIMTLKENTGLDYFQGEDAFTATNALTFGAGTATIAWGGDEPDDELYFLSGQATRTAIYLDFGEDGNFSRIGVAKSTAPILNALPNETDLEGQTLVYRSDEKNYVVIFRFNENGEYEDIYNDSFNRETGERNAAGITRGTWSITDGVLKLEEGNGEFEELRIAKARTKLYTAVLSETVYDFGGNLVELTDDQNRIESISVTKDLTPANFTGTYSINIPTENQIEILVISDGGSCDYSGSGCNWTIDETGAGIITFGSGQDEKGYIWQMADRAGGYAFVMTRESNPDDVEPGFMTRN